MFPRYLNRSRYPERAYPARHSERQHNGRAYNRRCEATPIREQSRTQLDLINFAQITHNAEIEKKPAKKWKLVDEIKEEKWRLDLSDLQLVSDDEQDGEVVAAVLETERTLCKDFCFFNYTSQKASITLKSKYGTWNILKTKILYCSRDEREVKEYSWKDVEKQKRLEFCVAQLDRNVFEKLFKIQFQFAYNDEPLIYDNVFWVEVSLPIKRLICSHFNSKLIP